MFNSAVSVVRVVFCHKQVEKNHLVLPAHIFVLCSKTPKTSGAHCHTGRLRWRGKLLLTYPHLPPSNNQAVRLQFFFTATCYACPVPSNEASVCDDASSGTSCHVSTFIFFCFFVVFFLLMFMLVFFEVEGADGLQSISLVHK